MERTISAARSIHAWKGTPSDLADAFEVATELVADTGGELKDAAVTVELDGGEAAFDIEEFRDWAVSDSDVRSASAFRGWVRAEPRLWVWLTFSKNGNRAVSWSVEGANPVSVHGIAEGLDRQLSAGRRRILPPNSDMQILIGALALFFIAGGVALLSLVAGAVLAAVSYVGVVASGYVMFLQPRLVPAFELLDPSFPESKVGRWKRSLVGLVPLLVAAGFGAVLTVLLERL